MTKVCDECIRLWSEYSTVTAEHVRLHDQLRRAVFLHDSLLVAQLTSRCGAAAEVQARMQGAAMAHEETHRSRAASA